MKFSNALLFVFLLVWLCPTSWAQKKTVQLSIRTESEGGVFTYDTTFTVDRDSEIDVVLENMGLNDPAPDQSIEKRITILDDNPEYSEIIIDIPDTHRAQSPKKKGKPMLGVYLDEENDGEIGLRVNSVSSGGAAKEAGIRAGDVLLRVGETTLRNYDDIIKAKKPYHPGDVVEVAFLREGRSRTVNVRLKGNGSYSSATPKPTPAPKPNNNSWDWDWDWDEHENVSNEKAFLGVYTESVDEDLADDLDLPGTYGVYVDGIVRNTAAEAAGLREGDVIVAFNGRRIQNSKALTSALAGMRPGDPLEITYFRDGRSRRTSTVLGSKERRDKSWNPPGQMKEVQKAYLGVYLEDVRGDGVRITSVIDNTAADDAGLQRGDIIVELAGQDTDDYDDLSRIMKGLHPGEDVRVRFIRDGQSRRTRAVLGQKGVKKFVQKENYVDNDQFIRDFEDEETGEYLLEIMDNPSLRLNHISYSPNPNNGEFHLNFSTSQRGDMSIKVYSPRGRIVYRERLQNFSGTYREEIQLPDNVRSGVYLLQLTQNGRSMIERISVR